MSNREKADTVDPAAILESVRLSVLARRATFADAGADFAIGRALAAANDAAMVSPVVVIRGGLYGRVGAWARRAIGAALRWYVKPLVERQNLFNLAAARALEEINAHQERLLQRCQQLEERLAAIEKSPRRSSDPLIDR